MNTIEIIKDLMNLKEIRPRELSRPMKIDNQVFYRMLNPDKRNTRGKRSVDCELKIENFEAMLDLMGYKIVVVPKDTNLKARHKVYEYKPTTSAIKDREVNTGRITPEEKKAKEVARQKIEDFKVVLGTTDEEIEASMDVDSLWDD